MPKNLMCHGYLNEAGIMADALACLLKLIEAGISEFKTQQILPSNTRTNCFSISQSFGKLQDGHKRHEVAAGWPRAGKSALNA